MAVVQNDKLSKEQKCVQCGGSFLELSEGLCSHCKTHPPNPEDVKWDIPPEEYLTKKDVRDIVLSILKELGIEKKLPDKPQIVKEVK